MAVAGFKKPTVLTQNSYNSLYFNPLTEQKHHHSCSEGDLSRAFTDNKENNYPVFGEKNKENGVVVSVENKENAMPINVLSLSTNGNVSVTPKKFSSHMKSFSTGRALKPSSLQFCMQTNEPEKGLFKSMLWDADESEHSTTNSNSLKIWDFSDSEAAPVSSWSTLPNRALLCRPLPLDIGRCTCVIVKEALPDGLNGGSVYSLYTNEGQGRQDRKLAVAHHRRHNGKSVFAIAQNPKEVLPNSDDSFIGSITANFMGSKYHILDQSCRLNSPSKHRNPLLGVVKFVPTVTTCTGSYRSMRAYIPKHQSMLLKNTNQVQHINGLPKDWEEKMDKVHKLHSRTPNYNHFSRQYELDYRDRGRAGLRIQRSVKNFQLTLEEHGNQTILQLGRVEKAKFVMDFRYPLTGYQAFCICLASIDPKLCCTA